MDPGASQFGNFKNYYSFNTVEQRITKIKDVSESIWNFKSDPYLDIGCNCGDLTLKLYEMLNYKAKRDVIILGIDIDQSLISKTISITEKNPNLIFKCIDIMDPHQSKYIDEFLKKYERKKFDLIFCLSITMWIHLNHSDKGLRDFLKIVSDKSNTLVIEPQPWKCYQSAVRRMNRANVINAFPNYKILEWKNDVTIQINRFLQNECNKMKITETEPTAWGRELIFYSDK